MIWMDAMCTDANASEQESNGQVLSIDLENTQSIKH